MLKSENRSLTKPSKLPQDPLGPLEKNIERAVVEYAKKCGLLVYKFTSPGRRGVPDRLFVLPSGSVFLIEFKRKNGKLTELQKSEVAKLRKHNIKVEVIYDIESGKSFIDETVKASSQGL